jgi:hypothetical protein
MSSTFFLSKRWVGIGSKAGKGSVVNVEGLDKSPGMALIAS